MIKSYFVLNSLSRQFCLNVTQPTELSISSEVSCKNLKVLSYFTFSHTHPAFGWDEGLIARGAVSPLLVQNSVFTILNISWFLQDIQSAELFRF